MTAVVWLMGDRGVAHAVPDDVVLDGGVGPSLCSRSVAFDLGCDDEEPRCSQCVTAMHLAENGACGTYRGYQRHRRHHTMCEACRRANTAHQRARREARPEIREKDRTSEAARWRARLRLCAEYPDRYRELLAEERAR